ncbi:hypothetical protein [Mycobacterium sp. SM3041]|uniref:hypothetical protein n=1 Tax=Mycobacterium sp. SM3041 TaxID=3114291 RepID=UPI003204A4E5
MNWPRYWAQLPERMKEPLREVGLRFLGMVDGIGDDGSILTQEAMVAVLKFQELERDILDAHGNWLSRTKSKFERLGIDWTTENLNRWSRLWDAE